MKCVVNVLKPGSMTLPAGYFTTICLPSKCLSMNWKPHSASTRPILWFMNRSFPSRLNVWTKSWCYYSFLVIVSDLTQMTSWGSSNCILADCRCPPNNKLRGTTASSVFGCVCHLCFESVDMHSLCIYSLFFGYCAVGTPEQNIYNNINKSNAGEWDAKKLNTRKTRICFFLCAWMTVSLFLNQSCNTPETICVDLSKMKIHILFDMCSWWRQDTLPQPKAIDIMI